MPCRGEFIKGQTEMQRDKQCRGVSSSHTVNVHYCCVEGVLGENTDVCAAVGFTPFHCVSPSTPPVNIFM